MLNSHHTSRGWQLTTPELSSDFLLNIFKKVCRLESYGQIGPISHLESIARFRGAEIFIYVRIQHNCQSKMSAGSPGSPRNTVHRSIGRKVIFQGPIYWGVEEGGVQITRVLSAIREYRGLLFEGRKSENFEDRIFLQKFISTTRPWTLNFVCAS